RLNKYHGSNSSWIFFCEEKTAVRLRPLLLGLSKFDGTKEQWLGHGLHDNEPTIIHHFAFAENPKIFKYPLFAAGFAISTRLLRKYVTYVDAISFCYDEDPSEFSIDPSHELALHIGPDRPLIHTPEMFCIKDKPNCATYVKTNISCGNRLSGGNLFFAVKTCHKFHENRIPVIQNTWGKKAQYIELFSDVENKTIPTTFVGVENTERGHCRKSLKILEIVYKKLKELKSVKWVVLTDDDTIISVPRLQSVLSCFENNAIVGERYGYNVKHKLGYNYITGGGGIALGVSTLSLILKNCHCPSTDSPDDMFIGLCSARIGIPLIHSPLFHQARPKDYAEGYLESQSPVSFHKHWMLDPIIVYNKWFSQVDGILHNEL
ncbi:hypothetical protein AAG570_000596, partial [Ranatra chinensis]